jgi:fatty acid desaturase
MTPAAIPGPKEQALPVTENLCKALLLIVLLCASIYGADRVAAALDVASALPPAAALALKWTCVALFAVADVVLLTGMGVLAHDAVHRVLFRSAFWNEFWGGLLSALTLIPFHANRQFHLTHHGYAHQPGLDPEDAMHHHSFVYAATMGSVLGLKEQYRLFFANFRRLGDRRCAARTLQDAAFLASAGAIYFWLLPRLGVSLAVTVAPMVLAFPLVFSFRALSDHYGIPAVQRERLARQDAVSGWVVLTSPWLEWLWSNVNYHEVHHKYPYLSHRYLPQVFAATRAQHPYLVVRGYWRSLLQLRRRDYYSTG